MDGVMDRPSTLLAQGNANYGTSHPPTTASPHRINLGGEIRWSAAARLELVGKGREGTDVGNGAGLDQEIGMG